MIKQIYRSVCVASVFFLLLGLGTAVHAQSRVVTGKIKDATGQALPGVNVVKKGTTAGTTTDGDGSFSIEADNNDVLVFSFIGYGSQEALVGAQTTFSITLTEDLTTLETVVVVGYGEMKQGNIVGAQTSVSSKEISRTVNTTIEQAIQGRAAGVFVTQNSGQPGGGMSVLIRGVNSINGTTEPLYVIDGIQIQNQGVSGGSSSSSNPLAGINPTDIENVEVLQGPAATAIYGSRATNGVVIITTKRGKSGDTKISYSYQNSVQTAPKSLAVMNLQQFAQMSNEYHDIAGGAKQIEFLDPSLLGKGSDWQQGIFQNAPMGKHQLSLSGGSEKTTFYFSGEYFKQKGVALGSQFDRYSVRLNLDHKATNWLSIGANFNVSRTKDKLTASQENIIQSALRMSPNIPIRNVDGTWGGADATNGSTIFALPNPIAISNLTTNNLLRNNFLGGLSVTITPVKGLVFRNNFNTNIGVGQSTYYIPTYTFGYNSNPINKITSGNTTSVYWLWNQTLQYTKQIGKHSIDVMATHEAQASTYNSVTTGRTGFITNDIIDINAGNSKTAFNSGGHNNWAMESYLGRLNYNYGDRYVITGTVRTDGSINFGPDKRWGVFPSIAAGWRVSQEKFFNVPAINELKIRVETGTTGNQGSQNGIYPNLNADATTWGTGFLPAVIGNKKLQWEQTKTNNIGFNLALLNNRIQLEADYYVKKTNNLILPISLPWFQGTNGTGSIAPPPFNIGELQNKGWGVTLKTTNINSGGFRWETNFNVSGFKTKITKFYTDNSNYTRTTWWMENFTQRSSVGQGAWLFRGYREDGLFQSVDDATNSARPLDTQGNPLAVDVDHVWVGDVKYKDLSGPAGVPDGKIDSYDETNIGNPYPKLFAGFTNNFSYRGFDLSVFVTATYGNDIYNYMAKVNTNPNNINVSQNMLINAMNYARLNTDTDGNVYIENPTTNVARISHGPNGNYARHTDKWVESGSYIRIKNVTLGYSVPAAYYSKLKFVKGARITFSAQNLATFTKYSGFDPEVGSGVGRDVDSGNQTIGVDYGRYPLTPVYSFSVGIDL